MKDQQCDILIIGSGAGGATVGSELAEAGFDVLIAEEGMSVPSEQVPTELSKSFKNVAHGWHEFSTWKTWGGIC